MTIDERLDWLKTVTFLAALPTPALEAIAQALQVERYAAQQCLALEGQPVTHLYILRSGRCETWSAQGGLPPLCLLPGAVFPWQELLLDQPARQTVVALTDGELWTLAREPFLALVQQFPELGQPLTFPDAATRLTYEQERQAALRPYLVPRVKQGIVGHSRYAVRLRQAIKQATRDRRPVLIFGEPGLEKDNIAALIHYGSPDRRQPLIKFHCGMLSPTGAELFGKAGGKPGLLDWLGQGTLILNNVHEWPGHLYLQLRRLVAEGRYNPVGDGPVVSRPLQGRLILIAETKTCDCRDLVGHVIKVPPLRVCKADIEAWVHYYIARYCRQKGLSKPRVAPEALRRLQSYDFPGNLRELASLVERALLQAEGAAVLTEEVFWPERARQRRWRWNLLQAYPWLRRFLRSPWWPDALNYGLTLWLFPVIVAIGFWGPQDRAHNVTLHLFWAWWWPVSLVLFPFLGRIWCAVCPFMIYGELLQRLSLKLWPRKLRPWPRPLAEKWGGWFLLALFALILLWEELWDLPNTAYLSSWLLVLITAGAVMCSQIYERRFWCRYLCPIGGMNGLFAKLSITELRSQQGVCAAKCTTYSCYKGGPALGEGQATGGCPLYSHPAQLADNRNCVLCMTCLKACPHRSVELNLRPPGIDLWTTQEASAAEVCLLLLLLGAVVLHRLPLLEQWWELTPAGRPAQGVIAIAALALPGGLVWFWHRVQQALGRPTPFLSLAYSYLPLVLGANLAYYLPLGLGEAGHLLPVTLATFGVTEVPLPAWQAHPAVIGFLQSAALGGSTLASLWLSHRISRLPLASLWPHQVGILAMAAALTWLIKT
ncbi:MAG: sigma 54-interacting transcriptional regulator [Gloeomargarita sp. GMQP_bins_5]